MAFRSWRAFRERIRVGNCAALPGVLPRFGRLRLRVEARSALPFSLLSWGRGVPMTSFVGAPRSTAHRIVSPWSGSTRAIRGRAGKWLLPESTLKTLGKLDATLLKLRHSPDEREETDAFHDEHRLADDRWSHTKAYSLRRGNSRRLLVTSANFSPAAWGRQTDIDGLAIENFELGVCIEQAAWPFNDLEPFASVDDVAIVSHLPSRGQRPHPVGKSYMGWKQGRYRLPMRSWPETCWRGPELRHVGPGHRMDG